jgi:hypothetical protein
MVIVFPESGGVYVQLAVAFVPVEGLIVTAAQAVVVELPIVALKITVPVGTADRPLVTVAPNVIGAPVAEGLAEEVTATVADPVAATTRVAVLANPVWLWLMGA